MRKWWNHKSGRAKTVTVLATLLVVQIGLCAGTSQLTYRFGVLIPKGYDVPMGTLDLMIWQAFLCILTLILLTMVVTLSIPKFLLRRPGKKKDSDD
jgi:hypothetical protein